MLGDYGGEVLRYRVREEGRLSTSADAPAVVSKLLTSDGPWLMLFVKPATPRALPGSKKTVLLTGRALRLERSPEAR